MGLQMHYESTHLLEGSQAARTACLSSYCRVLGIRLDTCLFYARRVLRFGRVFFSLFDSSVCLLLYSFMSVGEDSRFNFVEDCSDSQKGFDT